MRSITLSRRLSEISSATGVRPRQFVDGGNVQVGVAHGHVCHGVRRWGLAVIPSRRGSPPPLHLPRGAEGALRDAEAVLLVDHRQGQGLELHLF
jgi:hypothetical protein